MLVKFFDSMFMRGSIPYDEISSVREDHTGKGIIKCKSGEVILTSMDYVELMKEYESVINEEFAMMMGEDPDEEEDV